MPIQQPNPPRRDSGEPSSAEPVDSPSRLGPDARYCPRCLGWYAAASITAVSADGLTRLSADKVALRVGSPDRSRGFRFGAVRRRPGPVTKTDRIKIAADDFKLTCPKTHELTNTLDPTVVVGIIGKVGASKTHYLAGLVYELIYEERLKPIGADVAYVADASNTMDERITSIYVDGEVQDRTEAGQVVGPFSYRLTRNLGMPGEYKQALTFFDAAGEIAAGTVAKSAAFVKYIFDATGIILLIDPGGLPDPANPLVARNPETELTTRVIVDNLANALEYATGRRSHEQHPVICITIAKADTLKLPANVWPVDIWPATSGKPMSPPRVRKLLTEYSERCKQALAEAGGQTIIHAAEARFRKSRIFYSAVSATSQSPKNGRWIAPHPRGCTIPLVQALWFSNTER